MSNSSGYYENPIPYLTWHEYGYKIQKQIYKKDWDFIPDIIDQMYCENNFEKGE